MALTDKLSTIGTAIRAKTGDTALLTLDQMPAAIASISSSSSGDNEIPSEMVYYAQDSSTNPLAYNNNFSWFFNDRAIKLKPNVDRQTQRFYGLDKLFQNSTNLTDLSKLTIVFPDCTYSTDSSYNVLLGGVFQGCFQLRELPTFDLSQVTSGDTFAGYFSQFLRDASCVKSAESLEPIFAKIVEKNKGLNIFSEFFSNCHCLMDVPSSFKDIEYAIAPPTISSNPVFMHTFNDCQSLKNLVFPVVNRTSSTIYNMFVGTFDHMHSLRHLTFKTNNGNPIVVSNWKNQTIDLTDYVGYAYYSSTFLIENTDNYNKNKTIMNETTYDAYKDDPTAWVSAAAYSWYGHDSAVETINSLPDTSRSEGPNTIKFRGDAGIFTDQGGICTLAASEIAVATAKGWTVTMS